MIIERKKEVLRAREIFWQSRLNNRTVLIREWARTQGRIYLYKVFST